MARALASGSAHTAAHANARIVLAAWSWGLADPRRAKISVRAVGMIVPDGTSAVRCSIPGAGTLLERRAHLCAIGVQRIAHFWH
jgi:hypothetical protein